MREERSSFLKKRSKRLLSVGVALVCGGAHAAVVHVTIRDVRNGRGHVLVAVCPQAEFLRAHCAWQGSAPARLGEVRVDVAGVPPGVYAVQAFHDENDNGKLDRSFLGLPQEGMGFSRDAPMRFAPPDFADAALSITGDTSVIFRMRYY